MAGVGLVTLDAYYAQLEEGALGSGAQDTERKLKLRASLTASFS